MNFNKKSNTFKITLIAMAIAINYVGGQIALLLKLPIYLDSIGTIMVSCVLGPLAGCITPLISGIMMAFTGDIYSLYFAPVGMILGVTAGFVLKKYSKFGPGMIIAALVITLPGTIVCSIINAILFGGVTSSGSSILVQALSHTPLGLTGSIFAVQILTDYADRLISLAIVLAFKRIPAFNEFVNKANTPTR